MAIIVGAVAVLFIYFIVKACENDTFLNWAFLFFLLGVCLLILWTIGSILMHIASVFL